MSSLVGTQPFVSVIIASVQFHNFRYRLPERVSGALSPDNFWERLLELWLVFDQFLKCCRANPIARAIGLVDHLVLGNYRWHYAGHMRHLANSLRINRDDYIDKEGVGTVATTEMWASGVKRANQWIKRRLVDWDTRGVESLTFFTTYDLDTAAGDHLIRNSYAYLQSVVTNAPLLKQSAVCRSATGGSLSTMLRPIARKKQFCP